MEWLVWVGVALTLAGVALLIYCVLSALKTRKDGISEEEQRAMLQRLVPLNMLALMTSAMGLGAVTVGIILS